MQRKKKVGQVRVEPKTIGIVAVTLWEMGNTNWKAAFPNEKRELLVGCT